MKRRSVATRLGGALIALVAFLVFLRFLSPEPLVLTVVLPADAPVVESLSIRVVDARTGELAYQGKRRRPEPGRSMTYELKLGEGDYRVSAYARQSAWVGTFHRGDGEYAEVMLVETRD